MELGAYKKKKSITCNYVEQGFNENPNRDRRTTTIRIPPQGPTWLLRSAQISARYFAHWLNRRSHIPYLPDYVSPNSSLSLVLLLTLGSTPYPHTFKSPRSISNLASHIVLSLSPPALCIRTSHTIYHPFCSLPWLLSLPPSPSARLQSLTMPSVIPAHLPKVPSSLHFAPFLVLFPLSPQPPPPPLSCPPAPTLL